MIIPAVGMVVRSLSTGRFLLIEEQASNLLYKKESGSVSFVFGHIDKEESSFDAICREMTEELGGMYGMVPYFFGEILFDYGTGYYGHIFLYEGRVQEEFIACPKDADVKLYGWKTSADILSFLSHIRCEVKPVLRAFLSYREECDCDCT